MSAVFLAGEGMKKALVLGGGGIVGIAWEQGIIAGLKAGGINLSDADTILGTSAGSVVGSQLASGSSFDQADPPSAEQTRQLAELTEQLDLVLLGKVFEIWMHTSTNPNASREIGALAAQTGGWSEQQWLTVNQDMHGLDDWPTGDLRITALEMATGELQIHTAGNAPFNKAIAASCAVPAMFPAITINGCRYIDGGVISCTHADQLLPDQPDAVIIIAPITTASVVYGEGAEKSLQREVSELESSGAQVLAITPEASDVAAFGGNMMDPMQVEASWNTGFEKGRGLARGPAMIWQQPS